MDARFLTIGLHWIGRSLGIRSNVHVWHSSTDIGCVCSCDCCFFRGGDRESVKIMVFSWSLVNFSIDSVSPDIALRLKCHLIRNSLLKIWALIASISISFVHQRCCFYESYELSLLFQLNCLMNSRFVENFPEFICEVITYNWHIKPYKWIVTFQIYLRFP